MKPLLVTIAPLLLVLPRAAEDDPLPEDAGQFIELIQGLQEKFFDQMFIYESETRFVGPENLLDEEAKKQSESDSLAFFAHRHDKSGLLDYFSNQRTGDLPPLRILTVARKGEVTRVFQQPDRPAEMRTARYTLPHRVFGEFSLRDCNHIAFFQSVDEGHYDDKGFRVLGRQPVGDRPCLVVEYDHPYDEGALRPNLERLYIDLQRDGHPVRLEQFYEGKLSKRAEIQLEEVPFADGGRGWFPMKGEIQIYQWMESTYDEPVRLIRFQVIPSSLVINSGLEDNFFSIEAARENRYLDRLDELDRP